MSGYAELTRQLADERERLTLRVGKIDDVLASIAELSEGNGKPHRNGKKVERRKAPRAELPAGDKEAQAKALFLGGMKGPAIAKKLKVSVGSVYAWSSKGKWKAEKARQTKPVSSLKPIAVGKVTKKDEDEPPWME